MSNWKAKREERVEEINKLLAAGHTQREAAAALGISDAVVSRTLSWWREQNAKELALNPTTTQVLEREMNEIDNLVKMHAKIEGLVNHIIEYLNADNGRDEWTKWGHIVKFCGDKKNVSKTLVEFLKEQRMQSEAHFNMRKEYASMQAVVQFQSVVLDEIKQADPETAQRIVARLDAMRRVRDAVEAPLSAQGA